MFVPVTELSRSMKKTKRARGAVSGPPAAAASPNGERRPLYPALVTFFATLFVASAANATTFLDFTGGLSGWTTGGSVTLSSTTVTVPTGGATFTLTPAAGYDMARINAPNGGNLLSPNATLGLSANSLESFLNNGNGNITNFGLLTKSYAFNVGTYTFAWAYGAQDYQPFNDGAVFTIAGNGGQSLISLARNGSNVSDTSGPSPDTLILGSYGATPWLTLSFDITTAGNYQLGFAVYNWNDQALAPNLYVSGVAGTYTGTPVQVSGGTIPPAPPPGPVVIGSSGGNISSSVFDTSSSAYSEPTLNFAGGTLQYSSDTTTSKDADLTGAGGAIDTNGNNVSYTGVISGGSDFFKEGTGTLALANTNTYTGTTNIDSGTLALTGTGSIAASNEVVNNGALDISGTSAGASIKTMSGTGAVALGSQKLTIADAASTFDGTINGAGSLEVASGNLVLSGANGYTGTTSIDSGTLALTGTGSLAQSAAIVNNASFDISGTTAGAAIKTISGTGNVELGSQTLTITDASGTYAGGFSGAGAVNVSAGTIELSGASTNTGGVSIGDGAKVIVASDAALGDVAGALTLSGGTLANSASLTLARDAVISGTSTFETAADTSITANGKLSGSGALVKSGTGTLVLASDNSAFGQNGQPATIVMNSGSLLVTNALALGNANVTMNGGSLSTTTSLTLDKTLSIAANTSVSTGANTVLTVNAPITTTGTGTGNGCFEKSGTGTLVMTGRADIDPGTCVQDGKLYANGLLNSRVTVQSNGILRGTGTINGATVVSGRLAPGNSPGVLQIAGNVTMAAGSTYQEDINGLGTTHGPGSYSRLLVTGAGNEFVATGATLEPNLVNITGTDTYIPYVPKVGDTFRIITAEGGIVGKFASVTQPIGLEANTRIETYYNAGNSNSIDLVIVPTSYSVYVGGRAGNLNAQSTAAAFDAFTAAKSAGTITSAQDAVLYSVSVEPSVALETLATALSGEVHGALVAAAPLANRWLVDSVDRQLSRGVEANDGTGLWVDIGANRSDWKSDSVASGFDTTRSQVAIGWDVFANDSARAGVGFTHGKVDVQEGTASGSVTQNIGFLYGQLNVGRVILDGIGSVGGSDWESSRQDPLTPSSTLTTDFNGHDAALSVGMSLPLQLTRFALSPYTRVTREHISRDGFDEGTASIAALSSDDYSSNGTRVTAGLVGGSHDQRPIATPFTYQFNVGVGRDSSSLAQPSFGATFAGVDTTISTPDVGRTFGFAQVSATARLTSWMYGYVGVSGETRSGKTEDLGANLGVRATF